MNIKFNKKTLPVIFLMGPTCSGKTNLAMELYQTLPIKIISVDSALIYREMNIGTAKPDIFQLKKIPHKLIDICDPSESYSIADFYSDATKEIINTINSNYIPLLVGGTMLYFKILTEGLSSLPSANHDLRNFLKRKFITNNKCKILHEMLKQIDPISAKKVHYNDNQRLIRALEIFSVSGKTKTELTKDYIKLLPYDIYQFAIIPNDRTVLHNNIKQRFYNMLNLGFEEEVNLLFSRSDLNKNMQSMRCIGYRQMWDYLSGNINYDEMTFRVICATRQLAKHQITWLKNWSTKIHWLNINALDTVDYILKIINI